MPAHSKGLRKNQISGIVFFQFELSVINRYKRLDPLIARD